MITNSRLLVAICSGLKCKIPSSCPSSCSLLSAYHCQPTEQTLSRRHVYAHAVCSILDIMRERTSLHFARAACHCSTSNNWTAMKNCLWNPIDIRLKFLTSVCTFALSQDLKWTDISWSWDTVHIRDKRYQLLRAFWRPVSTHLLISIPQVEDGNTHGAASASA